MGSSDAGRSLLPCGEGPAVPATRGSLPMSKTTETVDEALVQAADSLVESANDYERSKRGAVK